MLKRRLVSGLWVFFGGELVRGRDRGAEVKGIWETSRGFLKVEHGRCFCCGGVEGGDWRKHESEKKSLCGFVPSSHVGDAPKSQVVVTAIDIQETHQQEKK